MRTGFSWAQSSVGQNDKFNLCGPLFGPLCPGIDNSGDDCCGKCLTLRSQKSLKNIYLKSHFIHVTLTQFNRFAHRFDLNFEVNKVKH